MLKPLYFCSCVFFVSSIDCAKILGVFTSPSYSHQIIYQPIWRELSLRGHEVTVLTPNPLNDPTLTNLTEIDLSLASKDFISSHTIKSMRSDKNSKNEIEYLIQTYVDLAEKQLSHPEVKKIIENKIEHYDLLMVEFFISIMFGFKDVLNCPMIGMSSAGLSSRMNGFIGTERNPGLYPELILPFSTNLSFKERVISTIFMLLYNIIYQLKASHRYNEIAKKHFGSNIRNLDEIAEEVSLVLANSNYALYDVKRLPPGFIEISGIHIQPIKALPEDLQVLMDNAKSGVIYFSLGSNAESKTLPDERLQTLIETFSELPYKVLWKYEQENLPNQTKNIEIRKWFPQQDILGHKNVKLFITQGGIQSIDEGIHRKVPILAMPLFFDQYYNAHHLVQRGVGLSISFHTFTKNELKQTIVELINNITYKENVIKLSNIITDQPMPSVDKAVWWIEYVLRHNGAKHLRYPGMDVPFYQYYLLDVIAFLLLVSCLILYIVIKILKHIIKFIRRLLKRFVIKTHVA